MTWALIVGIDQYDGGILSTLRATCPAKEMAAIGSIDASGHAG